MQMTWAGELEGWLTFLPKYHLVADEPIAAAWQALFKPEQSVEVVKPVPTPELAAMTWAESCTLLAADACLPMVRVVWPGDVPQRRWAICADWRQLPRRFCRRQTKRSPGCRRRRRPVTSPGSRAGYEFAACRTSTAKPRAYSRQKSPARPRRKSPGRRRKPRACTAEPVPKRLNADSFYLSRAIALPWP